MTLTSLHPVGPTRCGVVGAGNSAHALACYLCQQGHEVSLYARNYSKVAHLVRSRTICARGLIEGEFHLAYVGSNPAQFVPRCQTIFVCTTADAYLDVMNQVSPFLLPGQEVILFSSKFGGSAEVDFYLSSRRIHRIKVLETDALFACRLEENRAIWIRGFKEWTLFCAPRRSQTLSHAEVILRYFPKLEPAENLVQRGLTDFGALAHALTVLLNANDVDRQRPFLFYYDGLTERTVALVEAMEHEFQAVARAYGTQLIPARELLDRYYGCKTTSLLEAMRSVPNYRHSYSPESLSTRYLHEDVPCTLVPVHYLGLLAGLRTPVVDSVVAMATVVSGVDFLNTGRVLERFGWADYGASEIQHWLAQ